MLMIRYAIINGCSTRAENFPAPLRDLIFFAVYFKFPVLNLRFMAWLHLAHKEAQKGTYSMDIKLGYVRAIVKGI